MVDRAVAFKTRWFFFVLKPGLVGTSSGAYQRAAARKERSAGLLQAACGIFIPTAAINLSMLTRFRRRLKL
jgi:hypothetical protein